MKVCAPWFAALEAPLAEARAALDWRGRTDEKMSCLDPWTFAKVRRVEESLESLIAACEHANSQNPSTPASRGAEGGDAT